MGSPVHHLDAVRESLGTGETRSATGRSITG